MVNDLTIRKYRSADRKHIRQIACDTAFLGDSTEVFFEGRDFIADFLTAYFTDYERQSCFIAEIENDVAGYIIGTKNKRKMSKIFLLKIVPKLFVKTFSNSVIFRKKNIKFLWWCLYSFFKGQFFININLNNYPALLHINIKKEYREKGLGKILLNYFINYLTNESISGIFLTTHSKKAAKFFTKNGFKLLYKKKRSYYRGVINKDIDYYYFGMSLNYH